MGTIVGYAFLGACALAFLTLAHTRALAMKEKSRFAAEYFWYAGGLLPLAAVCVFLSSNGDFPVTPQRSLLFVVGAALGGSLLLGIGEIVRPTGANAQDPKMTNNGGTTPPMIISGGDNVVSIGQIGGITARVVNINPPVHPELRIIGKTETSNPDGSRTVTIQTEVASPITPGLLLLRIEAQGIQQVSIMPPQTDGFSAMQMRNVRSMENAYSTEIPSPRGKYIVTVRTRSAVPISLNASF